MRPTRAFAWGFLDLIDEAVRQGTGLRFGNPVGRPPCEAMLEGFSLDRFFELAGGPPDQARWIAGYRKLPAAAESYLADHLRPDTLVVSFELPPWLESACALKDLPWLDIRVSPIRFSRDLYLALRTNDHATAERIVTFVVPDEEIRLEASTLAASVRMHQRRLEEAGRFSFALDDAVVFVGQAPYDASLIDDAGATVAVADYADRIRTMAGGRRFLHKPHPFAEWYAEEECARLRHIVGREVETCRQNAYQILASRGDVDLVGLSSGMLQEARYFSKRAHTLFRPAVPLVSESQQADESRYVQVRFGDVISPAFWHHVLAPERDAPRVPALPGLQPSHARELLDQWWDYSKCLTWERSLWIEGFSRSGGGLLRDRVDALEQIVRSLRESA